MTRDVQGHGSLSNQGSRVGASHRVRSALLSILLAVLLLVGVSPFGALADEPVPQDLLAMTTNEDQMWEYRLESDGTVTIVGFLKRGKVDQLDVPDHIDGYEVSGIASEVFAGDTFLTSVYFPATITSLGNGAFKGCTGLEAAGLYAMEELAAVPDNCFEGCTALESVTIPSSARSIGVSAFEGCTVLASVGFQAPSSLETIGEGAFRDCAALTSTEIPPLLKSIGQEAYAGCSSLATIDCAFATKLETIQDRAFAGCAKLTEVFVPDWVSTLGNNAFADCSSLEVIAFGEFPSHVGTTPFAGCTSLKTVAMVKLLEGWQWRMLDLPVSVSFFLTNFNWGDQSAPSKVIKIGQQGDKTSLVVPVSIGSHPLVSIEPDACQGGCGLVSVTFAKGSKVTTIGDHAFQGCDQLTTVNIPASVTELGEGVFAGCGSLTDVAFETTDLDSLPANTFQDCDALANLRLPEGMTKLCTDSLAKCKALSYVFLPDSLVEVEKNAFDSCMTKKAIRMPDSKEPMILPEDPYFFPGFSMVSTSFEVTYGSWFEHEWLEPHIARNIVIKEARVYEPVDISDDSVVVSVGSCTYAAKEQTPPVTIGRWYRTLEEGTDFSVAPAPDCDCINVGSGKKAVITGLDPRFSQSREEEFSIQSLSVENVEMGKVDCTWDDDYWMPEPDFTVKLEDGTYTLKKEDHKPFDEDSYDNNKHAGEKTASITLVGAHNFSGTKTFSFSIKPRSLSEAKVVVEDQVYTGSPITPLPTSVQVPTRNEGVLLDLIYDTDYVLDYYNNTAVGTAAITISSKEGSDVCDSITVPFNIKEARKSEPFEIEEEGGGHRESGADAGSSTSSVQSRAGAGKATSNALPRTDDPVVPAYTTMVLCAALALLSAILLRLLARRGVRIPRHTK